MSRTHHARAMTRALWIGGIAIVALGASKGAARGATHNRLAHSDSILTRDAADSMVDASDASGDASALLGALPHDTVYGRSGKLRIRFVSARRGTFAIPILARLFGDSAVQNPGVYVVPDSDAAQPISFITLLPFESKVRGTLGSYRVGYWPEEKGRLRNEAYENPDGFVVVTPENQDLQVSEHFRLRDFLTHDQQNVWPKYMVLEDALIDKLELVIQDLDAHGVHVEHMTVMSGFRTPQYNAQGVGRKGGRAKDSRHQFGDAADVFVDNNRDGRMDDLNHDRRVDSRDARVIVAAVERVERAYPELAGGGGVYRATRAHGPFAHIDARGWRARWSRS
jgi:hypothetical protein